jgi:hypothetical protein
MWDGTLRSDHGEFSGVVVEAFPGLCNKRKRAEKTQKSASPKLGLACVLP